MRRTLIVLAAAALAGCGGAIATPTPLPTPTLVIVPTPTPWTYDTAPFQAHLSEYLDPKWTRTPPRHPYIDGGYIKGGLVIVSVDTGEVISPLGWSDEPRGPQPGPPDWGLPFAETPAEVGTVVLVWSDTSELWEYSDGTHAYRNDWEVKIVDLSAGKVVKTDWFAGSLLPKVKYGSGDLHADPPWRGFMWGLYQLERR